MVPSKFPPLVTPAAASPGCYAFFVFKRMTVSSPPLEQPNRTYVPEKQFACQRAERDIGRRRKCFCYYNLHAPRNAAANRFCQKESTYCLLANQALLRCWAGKCLTQRRRDRRVFDYYFSSASPRLCVRLFVLLFSSLNGYPSSRIIRFDFGKQCVHKLVGVE